MCQGVIATVVTPIPIKGKKTQAKQVTLWGIGSHHDLLSMHRKKLANAGHDMNSTTSWVISFESNFKRGWGAYDDAGGSGLIDYSTLRRISRGFQHRAGSAKKLIAFVKRCGVFHMSLEDLLSPDAYVKFWEWKERNPMSYFRTTDERHRARIKVWASLFRHEENRVPYLKDAPRG